MSVMVVAEHRDGALREVTAEMVTAAAALSGPVALVVIAADPQQLVDGCRISGVDEIITIASGDQEFDSDTHSQALAALIRERQPRVVVTPHSVNAMGYAPQVAARLDLGFASDVTALDEEDSSLIATRSFYGGKVQGEVELIAPALVMGRAANWPAAANGGNATVTAFEPPAPTRRVRHQQYVQPAASDVDITSADFLLAIGRGVGEQANIDQFSQLAGAIGATLACSRPLVDAGWMPDARQVGQSGRTVSPKVYLAFGISGAVQHLAGMKSSGTIIAINTDPEAAIFSVAHYGAVCDLFDVAEALEEAFA